MLTTAIKRARHMALLPYVKKNNNILFIVKPVSIGLRGCFVFLEYLKRAEKSNEFES